MTRELAAILSLTLLAGCASTLEGGQLTGTAAGPVDGIPYRVRDRFEVEVWQLTDKGYKKVGANMATLADPTLVYWLNFNGQTLSDANVKFEQREDGTLKTVHIGETSGAAGVATAAGNAAESFTTRLKAIEDAAETRAEEAAAEAEEEATGAESGRQSALTLLYQARVAEARLAELPATAKQSERIDAERQVAEAKMKANAAAVAAGQERPFPEF